MARLEEHKPVQIEEALLVLKDASEVSRFLEAVLSPKEHRQVRKRWHAYQLRAAGMPLAQIVRIAGVAMATATRAATLHQSPFRAFLEIVIARACGTNVPHDA